MQLFLQAGSIVAMKIMVTAVNSFITNCSGFANFIKRGCVSPFVIDFDLISSSVGFTIVSPVPNVWCASHVACNSLTGFRSNITMGYSHLFFLPFYYNFKN